jgi:hypothetical protein
LTILNKELKICEINCPKIQTLNFGEKGTRSCVNLEEINIETGKYLENLDISKTKLSKGR